MVTITVNGEQRNLTASVTLKKYLADLGLDEQTVVVERNRVICPRSDFERTMIEPGDSLEIVHFMGGG